MSQGYFRNAGNPYGRHPQDPHPAHEARRRYNFPSEAEAKKTRKDRERILMLRRLLGGAIAMRKIDHKSTRADVSKACDKLDAAIQEALAKGYSPA